MNNYTVVIFVNSQPASMSPTRPPLTRESGGDQPQWSNGAPLYEDSQYLNNSVNLDDLCCLPENHSLKNNLRTCEGCGSPAGSFLCLKCFTSSILDFIITPLLCGYLSHNDHMTPNQSSTVVEIPI